MFLLFKPRQNKRIKIICFYTFVRGSMLPRLGDVRPLGKLSPVLRPPPLKMTRGHCNNDAFCWSLTRKTIFKIINKTKKTLKITRTKSADRVRASLRNNFALEPTSARRLDADLGQTRQREKKWVKAKKKLCRNGVIIIWALVPDVSPMAELNGVGNKKSKPAHATRVEFQTDCHEW